MSSIRVWAWILTLVTLSLAFGSLVQAAPPAQAEQTPPPGGLVIDDVVFPQGEISFADAVISFTPAGGTEAPYDAPESALGLPDYDEVEEAGYVALGNGEDTCQAELVLEFRDNVLVDVPGDDLWIFEIGPAVEATDVYISQDGDKWISLGRVEGSTRGVDIAEYIKPDQQFTLVKLCDYPDGASSSSPWAGPDIDAVGAIGSLPRATPTPAGAQAGKSTSKSFCTPLAFVLPALGIAAVFVGRRYS